MALLERVDEIPLSFEQILNMIRTQKLSFPEFLILDIQELIRVSIESCDMMAVFSASVVGGLSIALGILTFSRRVMETVGKKLVLLDPFLALVVVLAEGLTVHFYTFVGVPVSPSQAVIGAVLGMGVVKGINTVSRRTLTSILIGWLLTPAIACFIAVVLYFGVNLRFIPEF